MIVIPAIDLKQGQCVRLRQGRMDSATVFHHDPAAQAKTWEDCGAARIHVVDLDGSTEGRPTNLDAVEAIVRAVKIPVQLGGGIRDRETIETYLQTGVSTVILGTVAARHPERAMEWIKALPEKIAVGIDARDGFVAVQGWTESTNLSAVELAARLQEAGPAAFIYTDIEKDGMMQGPNIQTTKAFAEATSIPVILSGGVSSMEDLRQALPLENCGVYGIIVGRALYEGRIDLRDAIALVETHHAREKNNPLP
ncbi:MAG: 1-(5-phosphoribosyl)-5-[(5-phosphoribosylamino)methylideneamino]imidazole-4-carboxamide isomerase [Thermodesulfobacteriota bacterium]